MKTPMRVRRQFRREVCEQARVLAEAPSLELASAFKATLEQRATYLTRQNLEAVQGSLETVLAGTDDSDLRAVIEDSMAITTEYLDIRYLQAPRTKSETVAAESGCPPLVPAERVEDLGS